jgi:hypothetical protein
MRKPRRPPVYQCVDCGLDTFAADEWFMVRIGSRCGKDGARRDIARSRAQKFSASDALRSGPVASSLG